MYKKYFGLRKAPFSIAPDPRYLYMSKQHREALAHLLYGIKNDAGFALLTGEVGTGKTTICRRLLERIPKNCVVAFVINPKLSVEELLATICDEFGIEYPKRKPSIKLFVDRINTYLLEAHANRQTALLIIDEAQNLSREVLEQIRLLTNLETSERKLLQIILLGQPELRDKLASPALKQLSQRIIARYHLGPLSKPDVELYVNHRLEVAGRKGEIFTRSSLDLLYTMSGGIPRVINAICDRALLGACVLGKPMVDRTILIKAACEVTGQAPPRERFFNAAGWLLAIAMMISAGALATAIYTHMAAPRLTAVSPAVSEAAKEEAVTPAGAAQQAVEAPGSPDTAAAPQEGPEDAPSEPAGSGSAK